MLNTPTSVLQGSRRREKGTEKIFKETIAENFPGLAHWVKDQACC